MNKLNILSLEETLIFIDDHPSGCLINVLTPAQYARQHIPGSKQACVFETAFLEHMKTVAPNKAKPVLLYGSGASLDASTAGIKLLEAGYSSVHIFPGGIQAWQEAGYQLEGEAPEAIDSPYPANLPLYKNYRLVPEKSRLSWAGRADDHQHWGSIGLKDGQLSFAGALGTGTCTVDMKMIKCDDLAGDEAQHSMLLSHLASEDFFLSRIFPETTLNILELRPKEQLTSAAPGEEWGLPNYYGRGELKLKNKMNVIDGELSLRNLSEGKLSLTGQLQLDRTKWGIVYGSARFFRFLGMHKVDDLISFDAMLIFEAIGNEKNNG